MLLLVSALPACRITPALSSLPDDLPAATEEWRVTGHDVRYAGAPVTFGPYSTATVSGSGLSSRWALTGEHLGFGRESSRFGFQLERERTPVLGAGCGSSLDFIRLQAGNAHVDIGNPRDAPALECSIWPAGGNPASAPAGELLLWQKGWDIVGTLRGPFGQVDIVSTRRLEGVPMPMGVPVTYRFTREGRLVAHVDVLDAGAMHLVPGLTESDRDWLAVAATALLMKVD